MDIVEEEHAPLGSDRDSSVNSLATAAVIVQETLRKADSSTDHIQSLKGRR